MTPTADTARPSLSDFIRATRTKNAGPEPELADLSRRLLAYLRDAHGGDRLVYAAPPARMQGGSDTHTYRFELRGGPPELERPLVLRLFPKVHGPSRALREGFVQNMLAGAGCPAPRVHAACTDLSILGGAFVVMEHLPGELMVFSPLETVPDMLAKAHAALHRLDPNPIAEALRERGWAVLLHRPERDLAQLKRRTLRRPRFHPIVDWLSAHCPPPPARASVCHGDFHPFNLLVRDARLTGILDWANFKIADPMMDVASTMMLSAVVGRRLLSVADAELVAERYLASYRAERDTDPEALVYYRTWHCVICLLNGEDGRAMWRHPAMVRDLIAWIRRATGVTVAER